MLNRSTCTFKPHTTSSTTHTCASYSQLFLKTIWTAEFENKGLSAAVFLVLNPTDMSQCLQEAWMGLIGGGSCGLGLFIGCVRRFSSGAILCSACAICTCVTRRFSTSKTLCSAMRCKKVLCWCGRFTRRGGQESAEWQIPPPCTLLYFALQTNTQIHKYTNTQIHLYTNTQINKYTNTQIQKFTNTHIHKYTNTQVHK